MSADFYMGTAAERNALMASLLGAIKANSKELLFAALAADGPIGAVHWKVALAIPYGFDPAVFDLSGIEMDWNPDPERPVSLSVAQACFHFAAAPILLLAAEADWPEMASGENANASERVRTMCSRATPTGLETVNLAAIAATNLQAWSLSFVIMGLSCGQDGPEIAALEASDPNARDLIRTGRAYVQSSIEKAARAKGVKDAMGDPSESGSAGAGGRQPRARRIRTL